MRKLFSYFLSILLFVTVVNAQPTITETKSLYFTANSIYKDNSNNYGYGSYNIGRDGNQTFNIYRTYFNVDLSSIPTNSTINEVRVFYSTDFKSYTFKLTNISSLGSTYSAQYASIGNSTVYHSGIGYGNNNFVSSPIKTQMQSSLSSRSMIIGALSGNETDSTSYAYLSMHFEVNITRPATQFTVSVTNDMDGYNGGFIGYAVSPASPVQLNSPLTAYPYESQSLNLSAYDNQTGSNGYSYVFNDTEGSINKSEWKIFKGDYSTRLSLSATTSTSTLLTTDNLSIYKAYLRKVCNVTFQNALPEGAGNTGYITVDGTSFSVTKIATKIDGNSITFWANNNQPSTNDIQPFFYKWAQDGSTTNPRTTTISLNTGYTAIFKGKPLTNNRYLTFNDGEYGSNVTLRWHRHKSANVTSYKIYQKVRINGVMGSEYLIATLSGNDTTYVDDCYLVSSNTTTQLFYDVRYVYSGTLPDNSSYSVESDPNYVSIYGEISFTKNNNEFSSPMVNFNEMPTDYSISNYPNPFNPTTVINYQLPKDGFVTLKVYNVIGKEIATLVNSNKNAGYYNVEFDASNLPSGVYIYSINANGFKQSKKMILTK